MSGRLIENDVTAKTLNYYPIPCLKLVDTRGKSSQRCILLFFLPFNFTTCINHVRDVLLKNIYLYCYFISSRNNVKFIDVRGQIGLERNITSMAKGDY